MDGQDMMAVAIELDFPGGGGRKKCHNFFFQRCGNMQGQAVAGDERGTKINERAEFFDTASGSIVRMRNTVSDARVASRFGRAAHDEKLCLRVLGAYAFKQGNGLRDA